MAESFLKNQDLRDLSDYETFNVDQDYIPDFGLRVQNTMSKRIDIDKIIIKATPLDKPYFNKDLQIIARDLFGVEKTVVEKTEFVVFLTTEKNLAIIDRDNQLRRYKLKRRHRRNTLESSDSD